MAEEGRAALNPEPGLPEMAHLGTRWATGSYIKRHFGYKTIGEGSCFTTETIFKPFTQTYHIQGTLVILVIHV